MTLAVKIEAALAVVALAVVTVAQAVPAPAAPESFWPTSVAGWFNTAVAVIAVIGGVAAGIRWWRAPVKTAIAESEARQQKAVGDMEKRLTRDIADAARDCNTQLDRFRESVTEQVNGYGRRLDRVEEEADSVDGIVNGLLQSMAESKLDRKHHGEALQRIEAGLERMREQHSHEMQGLLRALADLSRKSG
jgi:hypothetical protein